MRNIRFLLASLLLAAAVLFHSACAQSESEDISLPYPVFSGRPLTVMTDSEGYGYIQSNSLKLGETFLLEVRVSDGQRGIEAAQVVYHEIDQWVVIYANRGDYSSGIVFSQKQNMLAKTLTGSSQSSLNKLSLTSNSAATPQHSITIYLSEIADDERDIGISLVNTFDLAADGQGELANYAACRTVDELVDDLYEIYLEESGYIEVLIAVQGRYNQNGEVHVISGRLLQTKTQSVRDGLIEHFLNSAMTVSGKDSAELVGRKLGLQILLLSKRSAKALPNIVVAVVDAEFCIEGAPPMPLFPVDNALDQPVSLEVTWNEPNGVLDFHLQVASQNNFSVLLIDNEDLADNSYIFGGLDNSSTFYWRVRARYETGYSDWSTIYSFTTVTSSIPVPSTPELLLPSEGTDDISLSPELIWNPSINAVDYNIQLAKLSDFIALDFEEQNISANKITLQGLDSYTQYFWRVRARNAGGFSRWSSTWSFTTISEGTQPPAVPSLSYPPNGSLDQPLPLELRWNTVSQATDYQIVISDSLNFSSITVDASGLTNTNYFASDLIEAKTYYWKVRAHNEGGYSDWSSIWSFATQTSDEGTPPPVLVYPANETTGLDTALTLIWTWDIVDNPSVNYYWVLIQEVDSQDIHTNYFYYGTTLNISGLIQGTTYSWSIAGYDGDDLGKFSDEWTFSISP